MTQGPSEPNGIRRRLIAIGSTAPFFGLSGCSFGGDSATPTETQSPSPRLSVDTIELTDQNYVGRLVELDVTVENTGESSGGGRIRLLADDTERDTASANLEVGASTTVTLSYEPQNSDTGNQNLTIKSDDDSVTRSVTIQPRPEVSIVDSGTIGVDDRRAALLTATLEHDASIDLTRYLVGTVEVDDTVYRAYREITVPPDQEVEQRLKVVADIDSFDVYYPNIGIQNEPPQEVEAPSDPDFLVVDSISTESVSEETAIDITADILNINNNERTGQLIVKVSSDDLYSSPMADAEITVSGNSDISETVRVEYDQDGIFVYSVEAWVE